MKDLRHRYSVTTIGNGASVTCAVYALNRGTAAQQGRRRFLEVNPYATVGVCQVEELTP